MSASASSHLQRTAAWPLMCAALASGAAGLAVSLPVRGDLNPSGCLSISGIAPIYTPIEFGAAIEGIFVNYSGMGGCADCHTTNGGTGVPTGELDLDPQDSPSPYVNLINVESPMYPGFVYVVPNYPEKSFLFAKIDCSSPGGGDQMPLENYEGGLTLQQIALIYDWIAEGAPAGTTDDIFRGTFDIRGFVQ